jgi:hypothetical protein
MIADQEINDRLRRLGKCLPSAEALADSVLCEIERRSVAPVRHSRWKRYVGIFTGAAALLAIAAIGWSLTQTTRVPLAYDDETTKSDVSRTADDAPSKSEASHTPEKAAAASVGRSATDAPKTLSSFLAFSPIGNVDGWDATRLEKDGITVSSWKHERQREDPPLNWIRVAFDCSRLPKSQDVLMTAWVFSENGTVASFRSERDGIGDDKVALLFVMQPDYTAQSRVDIFIWKETHDGGSEAYGYTLSLRRIVELARLKSEGK